jgi:hypothetical protein
MPDSVFQKLQNVLGPERARKFHTDTLAELGLEELRSANDRLRFGHALLRHGGVMEAIGRSIKIQALLQGASRTLI